MSTLSMTQQMDEVKNLAQYVRSMGSSQSDCCQKHIPLNMISVFMNRGCNCGQNVIDISNYNNYGNNNQTCCNQDYSYSSNNNFMVLMMMRMLLNSMMQMMADFFKNQSGQCQTAQQSPCQATQQSGTQGTCSKIRDKAEDVKKLTNKNASQSLRNQKGTSYVVVCGEKCGRCKNFSPVLEDVNKNLGTQVTFYSLSGDKENKLYRELSQEAHAKSGTHGYPIIIKCVDGKATEFYDYSDIKNIYTNKDKMSEWFSGKIQ